MKFTAQYIPVLLLLCGVLAPLPGSSMTVQQNTVSVVATTSIVADTVQQVGGDHVEVTTLIGIGVDPHDFEATSSDIRAINNSDYIFWLGGGVEEGIEELLHFWEEKGKALALIDSVNQSMLISADHDDHDEDDHDAHGSINPHFWMSPVIWQQVVPDIASALTSVDAEHADSFADNADAYDVLLAQLHTEITTQVNQLADDQKFLVTQHNSFVYYAREYGFTARSLQGVSTATEAGVREIDELAAYLKEHDIEVVFTESTTPGEDIRAVIDAARAMDHTVVVGGQLYAGSLAEDSDRDTYLEMLEYNTDTIVSAILNPPEPTNRPLPVVPLAVFLGLVIMGISRRHYRD